jgi:hypothetical protein
MENYFIFKIHYSLTLYMTGIIWLVQMIHYPSFKLVGNDNFSNYHQNHLRQTSIVIAIPMVLEILTATYLFIFVDMFRNNVLFLFTLALLFLIWIVTFLVSVPKHNTLSKGFNDQVTSALIKTNWIRTIGWSLRALLLFFLLK